jgi:hypothetical protein
VVYALPRARRIVLPAFDRVPRDGNDVETALMDARHELRQVCPRIVELLHELVRRRIEAAASCDNTSDVKTPSVQDHGVGSDAGLFVAPRNPDESAGHAEPVSRILPRITSLWPRSAGRRVAIDAREEASMSRDARLFVIVLGSALLLVTAGCARHNTPGTTTTTLPSSTTGTPVVVSSAAPSAAAPAAGAVHHTINGEVTDVDRNSGKVSIRASDGSKVQVLLPPLAVATTNKGDRASIDVNIGPVR